MNNFDNSASTWQKVRKKPDYIHMSQEGILALSKEERAANGIMPIINRDVINKVAEWILDFTNGDVNKAAKILGIKETKLKEMIKISE
ncbi:MAG: hypothetical protein K8S23_13720 [Candidatus Cloacimonetes bacterium]|nr:hypothetical protein [Candidatus Cloacimonadota bacterium]